MLDSCFVPRKGKFQRDTIVYEYLEMILWLSLCGSDSLFNSFVLSLERIHKLKELRIKRTQNPPNIRLHGQIY